ncbi:MAG: hypothetical protein PVSMB2_28420 [Ktedonobacteraceae bacterium]
MWLYPCSTLLARVNAGENNAGLHNADDALRPSLERNMGDTVEDDAKKEPLWDERSHLSAMTDVRQDPRRKGLGTEER